MYYDQSPAEVHVHAVSKTSAGLSRTQHDISRTQQDRAIPLPLAAEVGVLVRATGARSTGRGVQVRTIKTQVYVEMQAGWLMAAPRK